MDTRLYVGNLYDNTTEDDLRSLFSNTGTVTSVSLIKDRDAGRSMGFAFVEMYSQSEAEQAIKNLDGKKVGDHVIHWAYGPGVIIQLDEKSLSGRTRQYYKVKMSNLTLWVPVDHTDDSSLRLPTSEKDFEDLFQILSSPGKPLPSNRNERRLQLIERLKDNEISSICGVVRDLILYKNLNKMNENDNVTLERSRDFLTYEWSEAFSIPIGQAEKELKKLLESVDSRS